MKQFINEDDSVIHYEIESKTLIDNLENHLNKLSYEI
jgi:hypothetical protein